MTDPKPFEFVDDEAGLRRVSKELARADRIAVDTESDSMHSYFEKVCLLQIATLDRAFLIDPLALNGKVVDLGDAFADPSKTKILHGADYDVVCLKRDFDFEIRNVFDTMIAAQCLDHPKIGLADLVSEYFGATLDKRHARTNWARRPLTDSELDYSYLDVKYLIELREILTGELRDGDVYEEAEMEFRRLEEREAASREFDPDGYRRIRGSKDLSDVQRSVLRELHLMRDRQARNIDRPPFKVLANDTLLRISRGRPRTRNELRGIKGVTSYLLRRYGDQLMKAVAHGVERGRPPDPKPRKKRRGSRRLSPRQQRQLEALRDWRKGRAAERGVPTLVVLPNHAILEVVTGSPRTVEDLGALGTVGEKRARLHGEEILEVLREYA
ncbi:MAG: HRDC domain-containing protein [Planctomycetota bacterium]